jgi:hypothetical protein
MGKNNILPVEGKRHFKKPLLFSLIVVVIAAVIYLVIDYRGPEKISLKIGHAFGFPCLRAGDLVVQEYDKIGNLWATRGMIIYKLKKGDKEFTRIAHAPTGLSILWLRNFSIFRRLTLRPECIEMIATEKGDLCAKVMAS